MLETTYAIVGGGIAGVTCAETLSILDPEAKCILVSDSSTVKAATNVSFLSKYCAQFDVKEVNAESLDYADVIHDKAVGLCAEGHLLELASGKKIKYKKVCICTGGRPKLISDHPNVIGLRDTDSVSELQKRLSVSKRIVIVGNGGIATELVHELKGVEVIWVIRDKHISATFIDPGAAQFYQELIGKKEEGKEKVVKRMRYAAGEDCSAALGPDWHHSLSLEGSLGDRSLQVEYESEVVEFRNGTEGWPVVVVLSSGKELSCDLVVSATGVLPATRWVSGTLAPDGGLLVDEAMRTSAVDVFAAGDACTPGWQASPHWLHMRLWTQARQQGAAAATAMHRDLNQEPHIQDFCFELFSHVTKLFSKKVVLLGQFNGQRLGQEYEILLRVTPGEEYVKFVLVKGRLQGAVLIGDTDLEEMCENLILDQIDLTPFGEDLLDPNIDIDDYFD